MKFFDPFAIAISLMSCTGTDSPEQLFLAAKAKMKDAERVVFRQDLVVEIPDMQEYDTLVRFSDFRKDSQALFGYEFKGRAETSESWYLDGVLYDVNHLDSSVLVLDDVDSKRLRSNSFRTFNPIHLLEKTPWQYLGDTSILQKKLLGYRWAEMDTVIDGRKIYVENRLWINPTSLLPEFYSRSAYQDGKRGQLIEGSFQDWTLENTSEPFTSDLPKGYLSKVEASIESPLLKVGTPAPDFELMDVGGKAVKLSDYRGKKVLLAFSMINCGWCKIALEQFAKPDYQFADNIVPLYINPVDSKERMEKYMSKVEIPFPVLLGAKEVGKSYGVYGFPTFYLIDENGKIEEVTQGFTDEGILNWKKKSE